MTLFPLRPSREMAFAIGFVVLVVLVMVFLRIVIGPFILALVLAYVFNPWIEVLERRGIKRSLVVGGAIVLAASLLALTSWFLVPTIFHQAELLFRMMPRIREHVELNWIPPVHEAIKDVFPLRNDGRLPQITDFFDIHPERPAIAFMEKLGHSTRFIFGWIIALILAPAFAFFVMRDFRRLMLRVLVLVPPDLRGHFLRFVRDVDHTLRAVLRGQILVITLLMTLYSTAFFLAGLPAGIVVGVVTGLSRLVPYLDIVVGGTLSFLILVTNGSPPSVVLGVTLGFAAIQLLDGLFLTPRIMGQFSGLHPFVIVISVLCFGDWFGFYGVLLAIPLAAVARVTTLTLLEGYKRSQFYRNGLGR
ncbi:MAG: AI-2E family transporter [Silvanigrellales bacterium]|nr:AI-2E family transporter [Silvanigrellales bacterium]